MFIDHHIQQTLIDKLQNSDSLVTYSALKQPDIENSLFSYHLNKLIAQKIVEKIDNGYQLTTDGARWLNENGGSKYSQGALRVSLVLVIQNVNGEYAIAQRVGQFKSVINDYLLPNHYYINNMKIHEQIALATDSYIPSGSLLNRDDFGFVQIEVNYDDKSVDWLFHVSRCEVKFFEFQNPYYSLELEWMTPEQIKGLGYPSAIVLRQLIDFTKDDKNIRNTPLFLG